MKKEIITEDYISKTNQFTRIVSNSSNWFKGNRFIPVFKNEIGNFELLKNNNGLWDVQFGCDGAPMRIKKDLKYIDDLKSLYRILVGKELE